MAIQMNTHIPTEERCTATHIILPDDSGEACIVCASCGRFIRPHKMGEECPGPDLRTLEEKIRDMQAEFRRQQ
jgi:hypothetical protein